MSAYRRCFSGIKFGSLEKDRQTAKFNSLPNLLAVHAVASYMRRWHHMLMILCLMIEKKFMLSACIHAQPQHMHISYTYMHTSQDGTEFHTTSDNAHCIPCCQAGYMCGDMSPGWPYDWGNWWYGTCGWTGWGQWNWLILGPPAVAPRYTQLIKNPTTMCIYVHIHT